MKNMSSIFDIAIIGRRRLCFCWRGPSVGSKDHLPTLEMIQMNQQSAFQPSLIMASLRFSSNIYCEFCLSSNNSLVTGDPAQHMESLVVVVIFNNSLVTEGGGVLLKQLPTRPWKPWESWVAPMLACIEEGNSADSGWLGQVKKSWKRSWIAQQGGAQDFGGEGLLGGGREENVAPEGLFGFLAWGEDL